MAQQTPLLEPTRTPLPPERGRQLPSRGRRRLVTLLVIVGLATAAYFGQPKFTKFIASNTAPPAAGPRGRGPGMVPVVAATARKGNLGVYLNELALVTPIYTVAVKSRVDGELTRVLYNEGQLVNKGDLLLEIDPRPFQVQLMQAQGQLLRDQALLDNAHVDLARYEKLLGQKAIPEQQLATQKATVAQLEGTVKIDEAQIESAKLSLTYCHIAAPITGRVGLRLVDPGNIVHASDSNALVVITQLQPISVIFTVSESDLPPVLKKMHAGQRMKAEAWNPDMAARLAEGTLATVDNEIDQTTGTVKLRANFENRNDALYPNQFVNIRLLVEEKTGVTLVPNGAVQRNSQSTYAYVVKPDRTVTVRQISVGTSEGDQSQIVAGLNPGDVVVTEGVDKLQEGSRVAVHFPGEAAGGNRQGAPGAPGAPGGPGGARPAGGEKSWGGHPRKTN